MDMKQSCGAVRLPLARSILNRKTPGLQEAQIRNVCFVVDQSVHFHIFLLLLLVWKSLFYLHYPWLIRGDEHTPGILLLWRCSLQVHGKSCHINVDSTGFTSPSLLVYIEFHCLFLILMLPANFEQTYGVCREVCPCRWARRSAIGWLAPPINEDQCTNKGWSSKIFSWNPLHKSTWRFP